MSTNTVKKINQKEYLKKYLSGDKKKKKKKDKKHRDEKVTVKIIDDDIDSSTLKNDIDEELLLTGDDAPVIVGEYIETQPHVPKWRSIAVKEEVVDEGTQNTDSDLWGPKSSVKIKDTLPPQSSKKSTQIMLSPTSKYNRKTPNREDRNQLSSATHANVFIKKERDSSEENLRKRGNLDETPPRSIRKDSGETPLRRRRNKDGDYSPRRRMRQDSDQSLLRRRKTEGLGQSPPREKRKDSDTSPRRRYRKDSGQSPRRRRNEDSDQSPPRKNRNDSDQSPPRRLKNVDLDLSPPRRKRKDSDQFSPPRRKRRDSNQSPPRRRKNEDSDQSPPRRKRKDSDQSPPRRKRRDSNQSPPRRLKNEDSDQSPPRRNRKDSDQSPPRRKRRDSNQSPPRRRKNDDLDQSPPRRKRKESAQSPLKNNDSKNRKNGDAEQPPNERHAEKLSKRGKRDQEQPRRREVESPSKTPPINIKQEKITPDNTPPRRSGYSRDTKIHQNARVKVEPESSPSPPPTHKGKVMKTLDGKKAGLQDAQSLRLETEERRRQEDKMFEKMSKDISGRDAEVRVRSTGRRGERARNAAAEDPEVAKRKEAHEQKKKELYDRWGKGLKQVEQHQQRRAEEAYESSKPLARYANDEDLDKHLREQERAEDPMLEYMRKKKKKKQKESKLPTVPIYEGAFPENRFGIRPGYRWDGVDRSNGYEKKWFDIQNERRANQEDAYKYSVEDM